MRLTDTQASGLLNCAYAFIFLLSVHRRLRRCAMKPLRIAALTVVAASLLVVSGCMASRLSVARELAEAARPYTAHPATPQRKLLIVGDSTALGTGADSPASSLAGWIGQANPQWSIDNLAANGARFADVVQQLQGANSGYDLVLVVAGGNDVMRLTSADTLRTGMRDAVALAHQRGRNVTLMPCGNVGHAPFFFAPLSWWMDQRSQTLHAIAQSVASEGDARYVRLLQPKETDPFALHSQEMHAADGLHPSSTGYRQWYSELVRQGGLALEGTEH